MDVNGDGKMDIVLGPSSAGKWYVLKSTGSSFINENFWIDDAYGNWWEYTNRIRPMDVNGDGKTDIVIGPRSTGEWYVLQSNGSKFVNAGVAGNAFGGWYDNTERIRSMEVNGDGLLDIVIGPKKDTGEWNVLKNNSEQSRITAISANDNSNIVISYKKAGSIQGEIIPENKAYPYLANTSPRQLVSKITAEDGRGAVYSTSYSYYNGMIHTGQRHEYRDLGFEKIIATNNSTNEKTVTYYKQKHNGAYNWHYAGRPEKNEVFDGSSAKIAQTQYVYDNNTASGYQGTRFIRLVSETSTVYEGGAVLFTSLKTNEFGSLGNISRTTESSTGQPSLTTELTFSPDINNWIINRPSEIKKLSGQALIQWKKLVYTGNKLTETADYLLQSGKWISVKYGYDLNGNIVSVTNPLNSVKTIEYDSDYKTFPVRVVNALGHVNETEYDPRWGVKTLESDANGNTVKNEYDDAGRLVRIINTEGEWVKKVYYSRPEDSGHPWVKEETRNDAGSVIKTTFADGLNRKYKETTTFTENGQNFTTVVDREFDTAGRLWKESKPYMLGCESRLDYVYNYDSRGRVIKKTHPELGGGFYERYEYHLTNGRLKVTTYNRKGQAFSKEYDSQKRVRQVTEPAGASVAYTYDPFGRLLTTVTADGKITSITYDSLGRKISMRDPNTGQMFYKYDDAGNILAQTDAGGTIIRYQYDSLNRPLKEFTDDLSHLVEYYYDDVLHDNGVGRLTMVTDQSGSSKFSYSASGAVSSIVKNIGGREFSTAYAYTVDNKLKSITYPDGTSAERIYSAAGFMKEVQLDGSTVVQYGRGDLDDNGNWCGEQNVVRRTGNGVETVIGYDSESKLPVSVVTSKDTEELERKSYEYDTIGNITKINDEKDVAYSMEFGYDSLSRLTYASGVFGEKTYVYNTDGNLTWKDGRALRYEDINHPYAVTGTSEGDLYTYDAKGNMVTRNGKTYSYNARSRLTAARNGSELIEEYSYDYSGMRVIKTNADGSVTYDINGLYSVITSEGNPDRHYKYIQGISNEIAAQVSVINGETQAGNFLIAITFYNWKSFGGFAKGLYSSLSYFVSQKENYRYVLTVLLSILLAFTVLMLVLSFRRDYGKAPAPTRAASRSVPVFLFIFISVFGLSGCEISDFFGSSVEGIQYYHPDHLGSVSMVTDAEGTITAQYRYDPYGKLLTEHSSGTEVTRYKYTTQQEDTATGLYYYKARYYDPDTGRFITPDSIVPDPENTQAYNRYMYVEGNPVAYADFTGHWSVGGFFKKVGRAVLYGVAGAAMGAIGGAFYGAIAGGIAGFVAGGIPGMIAGAAAGAAIGAVVGATIGGINGLLAGYNDIYSHNMMGMKAFLSDSTWSLPMTAIGLGYMGYLVAGGANFSSYYSKQSNAFIFTDAKGLLPAPGLTLGNTFAVGINENNPDFMYTLRHELAHTWQYRIYGLPGALRLLYEQATNDETNYRYYERGNLENDAVNYGKKGSDNRPWFLEGTPFDKFY
jgi:RHS repeat-associated protein